MKISPRMPTAHTYLAKCWNLLECHLCDLFHVLALGPFENVEEGCAADGGDAHEEAEFARVLAVQSVKMFQK